MKQSANLLVIVKHFVRLKRLSLSFLCETIPLLVIRLLLSIMCIIVLSASILQPYDTALDVDSKLTQVTTKPKYSYTQIRIFPQGGEESVGRPPWPVPERIVFNDSSLFLLNNKRYIIGNLSFSPGLGNILFQYAALKAIALQHNATLLITEGISIFRAYDLSNTTLIVSKNVTNALFEQWQDVTLQHCCRYYSSIETMNITKVAFRAYFQSFRYFHPQFEHIIRSEFQFLPVIKHRARTIIENAQSNFTNTSDVMLIGMHVRRGIDMTWNMRNKHHGHVAANARYFTSAMKYYRQKYVNYVLIFLIASDDMRWCRDRFKDNEHERMFVRFIDSGTREVDMCVLTMCKHTIMSQGTFSWWIAYLTNGDVTYFNRWPRLGSTLDKMMNRTEYFMPHWIGMD